MTIVMFESREKLDGGEVRRREEERRKRGWSEGGREGGERETERKKRITNITERIKA